MNEFDFITEKSHRSNMKKVHKKISKAVIFNGDYFESGRELARHLKLSDPNSIYVAIKKGSYKGKLIAYVK